MPKEIDRLPPQEALSPQENQESLDLSRSLLMFTGQGCQFKGMGRDFHERSGVARDLLNEADEAVGFPLSKIMFEGPEDRLKSTDIAQIAILAFEVAAIKAVEAEFGREMEPNAFAGHSLGTYAAMVAAGVTTFPDTISLVQERGRLMQEAAERNPGSMAAITGLDLLVLQGICAETGAQIGIINTDYQVVITGDGLAVARAIDLATASRARGITPLQVSGAWHSSLMESAQAGLKNAISATRFNEPKFPIVANTTAELLTTADGVKKELIAQLCNTVFWKKIVERRVNAGVTSVVEFGPKNVLSSFAKQIKRDLQIVTVNSFESAQKLAQLLQQHANRNPLSA